MTPSRVHQNVRIAGFFGILLFLLLGMTLIWRQIPTDTPAEPAPTLPTSTSTIIVAPSPDQRVCEQAGGKWVSCGNPCHGKSETGTPCIQVCEPQCICGGSEGLTCPAKQTCTDYEPYQGAPNALGICRPTVTAPTTTAAIREVPPGMECTTARDLCVSDSLAPITLSNPMSVTGTVIGAEAVLWRLTTHERIVVTGTIALDKDQRQEWQPFAVREFFFDALPGSGTGTLQFGAVAQGRLSTSSVMVIPLTWPSSSSLASRIYLSPKEMGTDCTQVVPVEVSFPRTAYPVEASLRRLLEPRKEDLEKGSTTIPSGTRLISLTVSRGVAQAVFSSELEAGGGGSCRVGAIRSQIEETLKRFPSVTSVVISVEGKTPEETLQP